MKKDKYFFSRPRYSYSDTQTNCAECCRDYKYGKVFAIIEFVSAGPVSVRLCIYRKGLGWALLF